MTRFGFFEVTIGKRVKTEWKEKKQQNKSLDFRGKMVYIKSKQGRNKGIFLP